MKVPQFCFIRTLLNLVNDLFPSFSAACDPPLYKLKEKLKIFPSSGV